MDFSILLLLFGGLAVLGLAGSGGGDDAPPPAPEDDDIVLTDKDDFFDGTDKAERVFAGAGNDTVLLRGGDDAAFLGSGLDAADGGDGNDTIFAGDDDDVVTGGAGDDRIFLEGGDDVYVDAATTPPFTDAGDDFVRGGPGNDLIIDLNGANEIYGEEGADQLVTLDGIADDTPDLAFGGFGADTLIGDDGDTLSGGDKIDTFTAYFDETDDNIVTITDFEPATETLTIQFDSAAFTTPYDNSDLTFEVLVAENAIRILVDSIPVAYLEGVTVINPASVAVQMI